MGTVLDLRRTDLRSNVLANPYWITSADIGIACDDKDAILFSFPITKLVSPGYGSGLILIHMMAFECITTYTANSDLLIGVGSIATDDVTTDGTITDVDVSEYFATADITLTGGAWSVPNGGDYLALLAAGTYSAYAQIVPADGTVLCIEAQVTCDTTLAAGSGRLHVLISEVPHVG